MLQPHAPRPMDLNTARIVWGALTFSIIMYVGILFVLKKVSGLWMPVGELLPLQMVAIGSNVIFLASFFIYKNVLPSKKGIEQKAPIMILCWALNESAVLFAFAATFVAQDGNGFFVAINGAMGIFANVLMFPKND